MTRGIPEKFSASSGHPFSICVQSKLSSGQDSEAVVKSSMYRVVDPRTTAESISGFSKSSTITGKGVLYKQSAAEF